MVVAGGALGIFGAASKHYCVYIYGLAAGRCSASEMSAIACSAQKMLGGGGPTDLIGEVDITWV